jgi:hypothetical protein
MSEITIEIPDFNTLNLIKNEDSNENYINLQISLEDDYLHFHI